MKLNNILLLAVTTTLATNIKTLALTNSSCPDGGSSYDASTQQQILPWKWSEQQWSTNLNDIANVLGNALGVPGVGGVWSVASAIWDFSDEAFQSDNTIAQIMS